jgi:sugar O-acyltransferase (sialic acid O-acetyltransferase NeuD family)
MNSGRGGSRTVSWRSRPAGGCRWNASRSTSRGREGIARDRRDHLRLSGGRAVTAATTRVGEAAARLVVVGASDQAFVVLDVLGRLGVLDEVDGVLDASGAGTHLGRQVGGHSVQQTLDALTAEEFPDVVVIPAVGAAALRSQILLRASDAGLRLGTLVDPRSLVSPSAKLGAGVFVAPLAFVGPYASVGDGAIINTGAIVEHHVEVGPLAHVGPGAVLAGHVRVGRASMIGAGASVRDEVHIGNEVTVGLGAAVIGDLPAASVMVGVPARPIGAPGAVPP